MGRQPAMVQFACISTLLRLVMQAALRWSCISAGNPKHLSRQTKHNGRVLRMV